MPQRVNPDHKKVVEAGGGVYEPSGIPGMVMFDSPKTGSTLAIKECDLTPEAVRRIIKKSNEAFGITSVE